MMLGDALNDPTGLITLREQCLKVQQLAVKGQSRFFDVDGSKFQDVIDLVVSTMRRDYQGQPDAMPAYGQWQRFGDQGHLQQLLSLWAAQSPLSQAQRLTDLFIVTAALDIESMHRHRAWSYQDPHAARRYTGSQGIALAVLELFMNGVFSTEPDDPCRVDADALIHLDMSSVANLQATATLPGLENRIQLLNHMGTVIKAQSYFYDAKTKANRPGYFIDYLLGHASTIHTKKGPLIPLETLWPAMLQLGELWGATPAGDVHECPSTLLDSAASIDASIPFHKHTQWLVYSLCEPLEKLLGAIIEGKDLLTPVPDYAQGGLLLDTGFLTLKRAEYDRGIAQFRKHAQQHGLAQVEVTPMFDANDPVVTEWRALTVAYIDIAADHARQTLHQTRTSLPLSKFMEAGSFNVGKELAEISRPLTQIPPIAIQPTTQLL
ncbi:hypothetical protein BC940DRAFT_310016 [Gongronella butleri]|nr:hypothetical protein BC940DRAFT_310016 [Gongronella butleri]